MNKAIRNAASLVNSCGYLILAIYNRHLTSPVWAGIKYLYCKAPTSVQKMMIATLYPIIWAAKLLVVRENPNNQSRGMDFYYDVIDWIGGYPYEYANINVIQTFIENLGIRKVFLNKLIGSRASTVL